MILELFLVRWRHWLQLDCRQKPWHFCSNIYRQLGFSCYRQCSDEMVKTCCLWQLFYIDCSVWDCSLNIVICISLLIISCYISISWFQHSKISVVVPFDWKWKYYSVLKWGRWWFNIIGHLYHIMDTMTFCCAGPWKLSLLHMTIFYNCYFSY